MENATAPNKKASKVLKPVDAGQIFWRYARYWPWFVLTLVIGLGLSYIYLRYTNPLYAANMTVMFAQKSGGQLTEEAIFEDLRIGSRNANMENEIGILSSSYLMARVAGNLGLQYHYVSKGQVKDIDLYKQPGINVVNWQPKDSVGGYGLSVMVNQASPLKYILNIGEKKYTGEFGKALLLPTGTITLGKQQLADNALVKDLMIEIRRVESIGASLAGRLNVLQVGRRSSILNFSISDVNVNRAKDILGELVKVYDQAQIEDKSKVFDNTIDFIDERLDMLTSELSNVEGNVANFKSENKVVDLDAAGSMVMTEVTSSSKDYADMDLQLEILDGIEDRLNRNPTEFDFVPTNTGITNGNLVGLLASFNSLMLDRERAKASYGPNNPAIKVTEQQLANLRVNILNNIKSVRSELELRRSTINNRYQDLNSRLSALPYKEKQLIEIQRQQSIKQNLYLYLLQKREETALSKSVTVTNSRILELPRSGGVIKPKPTSIWAAGIILGLLLPIGVITLAELFNNKVRTENDIKKVTDVPILSTITHSQGYGNIVLNEKSRSATAEMFRLLRANLQFVGEGVHNRCVLITSSVSGEGKSFVCLNLGLTLAFADKKTVVLELDMRKPKLAKYMNKANNSVLGITQYLVDDGKNWEELIQPSDLSPNLHFIACGPLPPNPSELLLSEKLQKLLETLRKEYDFVLIDTPPVGLVSDALILGKYTDVSLYVVRFKRTQRGSLDIIQELYENEKLPRPYILFNGVKESSGRYGYGYGYGYGYYEKPGKKGRKFFQKGNA